MAKGKVNITKATYELQRKVGSGPVDESAIKASQSVIENNQVDFAPVAHAVLDRLQDALEQAKNPAHTMQDMKAMLTKPVMELKANAAIFHYDLIGSLASVMLNFLENIQIMDQDSIDIVKAHHVSVRAVIVRKITGDGGETGESLINELKQACDRYYNKKFPS